MSEHRPTLIVHTVYFPITAGDPSAEVAGDPERVEAERLGRELYDLLSRPLDDPLAAGAGVPVRVATRYDRVDLEEADHVVLLPVLGARSHELKDVRARVIERLTEWSEAESPPTLLPIPCSKKWRDSGSKLPGKLLLTELGTEGDARQDTLDEIVVGLARALHGEEDAATKLFISYATADSKATEKAALRIKEHVEVRTTGRAFFDSADLLPGEDLEARIDDEAGRCVFMMVRSDAYSSRSWCQKELIQAKLNRRPFLSVELLSRGEGRSLPYAGNGPTVVWKRGEKKKKRQAAKVVRAAMVEALRCRVFELEADRVLGAVGLGASQVVPMTRPPELLDLPALRETHPGPLVILHPDPELSVHEQDVLRAAHKRISTFTPTTAFRGALASAIRVPLSGWQVALSLSDTPDVGGPEGNIGQHADDATTFLARALIGAGATIAYGGDFRKKGFTERLSQLIGAYNQTAKRKADFLHSYLAGHIPVEGGEDLAFTDHWLGRTGACESEAALAPPPAGVEVDRHRSALYFSDMRRVMESHVDARIVMAGQATPKNPDEDRPGYGGRYPGVVEEAWRALEAGKPLFVLGGFGGAAGMVAEVLLHDQDPARLREETYEGEARFGELTKELDGDPDVERLGLPRTMEEMAAAIRTRGRPHLASDNASTAWNGLTVEENRTLFATRDPLTMTSLVLKGLLAKQATRSSGTLRIELARGDIVEADAVEVLVIPTFSDVPPSGVATAIDRVANGAATRAHQHGQPVKVGSEEFGAEYLFAADLGPMNEALGDVAGHVRRASHETSAMAKRYGFSKLAVVTYLGNVAASLDEVVAPMIDGLRNAPADAEIVWFEKDQEQFDALEALLEAAGGVTLTKRKSSPVKEPPLTARERRTIVGVRQLEDELDVSILVPYGNALVPGHRTPLEPAVRDELVGGPNDGAPAKSILQRHGETLARLLFGDDAPAVLEACRESGFVVVHDLPSSGLPYEALSAATSAGGEVVTPATAMGMIRRLYVSDGGLRVGIRQPPHVGKLRVLLVTNPTEDLDGAEQEARSIRAALLETGVELVELAREEATVDAVKQALADPATDVLHYCGHAFFIGAGEHDSGLACADGYPLTLAGLRGLERVPRVVFVNACQGGRMRAARPEVPGEMVHNARTFAEFFLRAGIDAYLGTFWEVSDSGAATFASTLYRELADGTELGEAVVRGRRALKDVGNSDWANYLLYGDADFRLIHPTAGR